MAEKSYTAGCHCGFIRLTATLSPGLPEYVVTRCNCSVCRRLGYLLVYPTYEEVTWHNNSDQRVSRYMFNTKTRDHMFCPKCGASIGIDFHQQTPKRYGLSLRAFDNIDLDALTYKDFDGMHKLEPGTDVSGTEYKEVEVEA